MTLFDLVIKDGLVVDGTGNQRVRTDIGIRDGRIARVGRVRAEDAVQVLDAAGLVVESSFTSVREMQQFTSYNWIPLSLVQTQYFDSLSKARKLCLPTLFMHGSADYRIPIEVARKLYAAAPEPKRWLLVEGARLRAVEERLHEELREAREERDRARLTPSYRVKRKIVTSLEDSAAGRGALEIYRRARGRA